METGTVKWFNNVKGFGFLCPEGGGEDIFAHYSTIQMDGYRTLKAGQTVGFDVHQGPKGNHASLIAPLGLDVISPETLPLQLTALA
jgi:CspA family cold shock protein